ncbi:unnamed protein product [Pocillopora meandrina]|uniref:Uncharacterized protein n=1 Tax=Pocillopora meandrina TaxID=46732 RepID=A0AAU9WRC2_9CNID|nr:unnamed protein product [Pocillopora meandrina]
MGKPRKETGRERIIIARFLRFSDRERVLKCGRKLKETGYKMYEDLLKEIHEMRKLQMEKLKNARKDGKRAYFSRSEPDKLSDIIFLQETYSTPDVFDSWKFQWLGDMYYSHGSNHSKGVLVLIRETLQFELKSVKKDSQGRFVIVEALVQDSPVLLINIYAPNNTHDAVDFYENLRTTLLESDYDQDYRFIMGVKQKKKDVVTKIRELMLDFNLVDIWRLRNPDKKRYTWKQNKPLVQRRLDY